MGLELADFFREYGADYRKKYADKLLPSHRLAMWAIEHCRTERLGGQVYGCPTCQEFQYSYHSCRNRHCPKCQHKQTQNWLKVQQELLLPVPYFFLTFTLPAELRDLVRANQKTLYSLLFQASAEAAIDDITLALGVVSTDAGNMIVTGPDTAPELTPYDLTLYYDITESTAGDRWYGSFSLGSDSAHPGNIGMIAVDVVRQSDDVAKTVTPELAYNGDTVTYEITIDSNITPTDLIYTITDTIPDGLILDPASISVSTGSFVVDGASITWTAPMPRSYYDYAITTVDNDPLCDTGFGGYVNLEDLPWDAERYRHGMAVRQGDKDDV